MHPVLLEIPIFGGVPIYMYGALVATGFLFGIIWIVYETKRLGLDTARALDLVFYIIISAIVGSRLVFLLVNDPLRLLKEPWSLFMVWEGGLVFFGGVIVAMIVSIIYLKKKRLNIAVYCDLFAPALALGHSIGRLGCLMAGCCHGRFAGDKWYAIVFPDDPASLAPINIPLYPTQTLEAIGDFFIFLFLVLFRKHKKFNGEIIGIYMVLYSILRFFNEYFRGDTDRGYFISGVLSTSQGISLIMFAIGAVIMVRGLMKKRGVV